MKKCSRCKILKELSFFSKDKYHPSGHKSACKECAKSDFDNWKKLNHEKAKISYRKSHYKSTYGLSDAECSSLVNNRTGVCPICGKIKLLVVDHCHTTGKVRGFICAACNSVLGYSKDNTHTLTAAIKYLKDFYG